MVVPLGGGLKLGTAPACHWCRSCFFRLEKSPQEFANGFEIFAGYEPVKFLKRLSIRFDSSFKRLTVLVGVR